MARLSRLRRSILPPDRQLETMVRLTKVSFWGRPTYAEFNGRVLGFRPTTGGSSFASTCTSSRRNPLKAYVWPCVSAFYLERDPALVSAIQSQISNALLERAVTHRRYTLTVDVIEHRSYFTLGNWNASTRLKWRVQQGNGSILREGVSVGEGHRSNMAGYLTAGAVSQDAFNVAMADLMSSLSAIPTG